MASMVPMVILCVVCREQATWKVLNDRGLLAAYMCEQHAKERVTMLNAREQSERELRSNRQAADEKTLNKKMRMNGNSANGHKKVAYIELSAEEIAEVEACLK